MLSFLNRTMTGSTHERDTERRSGYVALTDVLHIVAEQTDRFEAAILDLKASFREESASTRMLVDTYRVETHRRLDALEAWRSAQELDEAFRRGFWHVVALGAGRLFAHWQAIWAIVVFLLGTMWLLIGHPPLGIGPIKP